MKLPEPKWAAQALAHWDVNSFTTKDVYRVYLKPGGTDWFCQCFAYRYAKVPKPDCKHIKKIKGMEQVPIIQSVPAQVQANGLRLRRLDKKTTLPEAKVVYQNHATLIIQTSREVTLEEDY